jgi:beta-lactamase superfamily II metal-dependent hydrolase
MIENALDRQPSVRIWFMDVGKGDCTIVLDESTKNALVVDCPSKYVDRVREILDREQGTLHTCVVTHWDADHYAGVARLAVSLPITRVMYNHDTLFATDDSPPFAIRGALKGFLDIPKAPDVLGSATSGDAGNFGDVSWQILAPNHHELTMAYVARRRNVASAVVDISVPSARILIGGDAVGQTWNRLVSTYSLKADVLRWPHHGADLAGDPNGEIRDAVMNSVLPRYVIVSTDSTNTYGHPSNDVIRHIRSDSVVMCTQVTAGCFGYLLREERESSEARQVISILENRLCAGTVRMDCFSDSYKIFPDTVEHLQRIRQWARPMCQLQPREVVAAAEEAAAG